VSPGGVISTVAWYFTIAQGIALDQNGKLVIATADQIVTPNSVSSKNVLAGSASTAGFSGDGLTGLQALLDFPGGVVVDNNGIIYFCDQNNNRIRKLAPDSASQVVLVSGDKQSGPAGMPLPFPLVVQVNGSSGAPFSGVTVNYAITSGNGGRLSATQTSTGADGRAGVTLTLPSSSGTVTVTATVGNLPPVTFTATSINTPATVSILGGNNQVGVAGSQLPQILAVLVLGVDKSPMSGVPVNFAVASGSATLNPASMSTAFDGSAYTAVTLGSTPGPVTVTATVAGLTPVTFNLTSTPTNGPQISPGGIVGAGLSTPPVQAVSPNGIISIFGKNFAPDGTLRKVAGSDLVDGLVPTNLGGVCVLFGTQRAPIFLITSGQLNVQTPQLTGISTPTVQVITGCDTPNQVVSPTVSVALQAATPEFFYAAVATDGRNPIAATDAVSGAGIGDPARLGAGFAMAHPGQTITIYATGMGLTTPPFLAGQLPPGGAQVSNIIVSIDGLAISASAVQYAGVAPQNAGLYQLNLVLPAFLTSGDHSITMTVAGFRSPAGFISVGN
jgi:uncharacterized protein (TIGR03437 family)